MTPLEIREQKAKLDAERARLRKELKHLDIEYQHLQLECTHPNKYSDNTWGRDPGGAYCPDCGKSW